MTDVSQSNHVLGGNQDPHMNEQLEIRGTIKRIESLCCGVRSKRDHSVLNKSTGRLKMHDMKMTD